MGVVLGLVVGHDDADNAALLRLVWPQRGRTATSHSLRGELASAATGSRAKHLRRHPGISISSRCCLSVQGHALTLPPLLGVALAHGRASRPQPRLPLALSR